MDKQQKKSLGAGGTTALFAILLPICLAGAISYVWYDSAVNSEDPYDEIFIEINQYMPEPLRAWGCGKVLERFPEGTLPPLSCKVEDRPQA